MGPNVIDGRAFLYSGNFVRSFRRKPESSLVVKGLDPGFRRGDDEEKNEPGIPLLLDPDRFPF